MRHGRTCRDRPEPYSTWVHGTRLGREHRSVRRHLIEDHGVAPRNAPRAAAAVHGMHDGEHRTTWAYAHNLPHPGAPTERTTTHD